MEQFAKLSTSNCRVSSNLTLSAKRIQDSEFKIQNLFLEFEFEILDIELQLQLYIRGVA